MKRVLFIPALLLILSACTTRVTDFTIISTKNHQINVSQEARGPRVEGEDMAAMILFIPTGQPNVKNAVDRAIESAGPGYDALVDGVVNYYFAYFILGASFGYKVEGTPIKTSDMQASLMDANGASSASFHRRNILFHSRLDISNDETIRRMMAVRQ